MKKKVKQKSIVTKVVLNVAVTITLMCMGLSLGMWNAFKRELSTAETKYMSEVLTRISLEVNSELNHYIDTAQGMAQSSAIKEYLLNIEGQVYAGEEILEEIPDTSPLIPEVPDLEEENSENAETESDDLELDEAELDTTESEAEESQSEEIEVFESETSTSVEADVIEVSTLSAVKTGNIADIEGYEEAFQELKNVADMFGDSVSYVTVFSLYANNFVTHNGEQAVTFN